MRILDTGPMSARHNIAMTAALAELHRAEQIPDTLRFWRYPRALLLGRHDTFAPAYKVKACLPGSMEVARRTTAEHAAYVSPGVLAWCVVADSYRFGARLSEIRERICSAIASGLARFGLPARFRPRDEIEIAGRRVCAAGGAIDGFTAVFEGAVLVDLDASELQAEAGLPNAPNSGVTTVAEWLGRVPADDEIKSLLVAGLSHCWHRPLLQAPLTRAEAQLADRLFDQGVGRARRARAAPKPQRATEKPRVEGPRGP